MLSSAFHRFLGRSSSVPPSVPSPGGDTSPSGVVIPVLDVPEIDEAPAFDASLIPAPPSTSSSVSSEGSNATHFGSLGRSASDVRMDTIEQQMVDDHAAVGGRGDGRDDGDVEAGEGLERRVPGHGATPAGHTAVRASGRGLSAAWERSVASAREIGQNIKRWGCEKGPALFVRAVYCWVAVLSLGWSVGRYILHWQKASLDSLTCPQLVAKAHFWWLSWLGKPEHNEAYDCANIYGIGILGNLAMAIALAGAVLRGVDGTIAVFVNRASNNPVTRTEKEFFATVVVLNAIANLCAFFVPAFSGNPLLTIRVVCPLQIVFIILAYLTFTVAHRRRLFDPPVGFDVLLFVLVQSLLASNLCLAAPFVPFVPRS
ncbi:hypothetical protein JCM10049v2_004795 [Rhodotorula toruloides]